jgi:hypothetical protein
MKLGRRNRLSLCREEGDAKLDDLEEVGVRSEGLVVVIRF